MSGKSKEFQIGCNVNSYKLQLGVLARSPCYDSKTLFHSRKREHETKTRNLRAHGTFLWGWGCDAGGLWCRGVGSWGSVDPMPHSS